MNQLNLPGFELKLSGTQDKPKILDILRRRYVALTPEEWVRQHFVHYLIEHKGYPQALMANEIQIQIGDKQLRADSVLYDSKLQPRMIDRKSTRLNSSHANISYAVFCLKKKKNKYR